MKKIAKIVLAMVFIVVLVSSCAVSRKACPAYDSSIEATL